jgi:hypothetical protein
VDGSGGQYQTPHLPGETQVAEADRLSGDDWARWTEARRDRRQRDHRRPVGWRDNGSEER